MLAAFVHLSDWIIFISDNQQQQKKNKYIYLWCDYYLEMSR